MTSETHKKKKQEEKKIVSTNLSIISYMLLINLSILSGSAHARAACPFHSVFLANDLLKNQFSMTYYTNLVGAKCFLPSW